MDTLAVVLDEPERLALRHLDLTLPGDGDVVVDVEWSGISTGTEKLLWAGRMPHFPGMGYPLVPGYESVGLIAFAGAATSIKTGTRVYVPGANCYGDVKGLFGGSASRIVVGEARVLPVQDEIGENGTLLALAATAYHAAFQANCAVPQLIVGHGALGRLMARILIAAGHPAPTVWEKNAGRMQGDGYSVVVPEADTRRDYASICDVSGDSGIVDTLVMHLAPGGEIVLAGFYDRLGFAFPPAFMKEVRMRIAAQFQRADLVAVNALVESGRLSLDGFITHRAPASDAPSAYRTAFEDPDCLKMILDWRAI